MAGGEWPERARKAAQEGKTVEAVGLELLIADIYAIFRLSPVSSAVDRLSRPEAEHLEAVLAASGIHLRTDDASMADFNALRARYEPLVHSLSNFLLMPLPEWIPAADAPDRWHPIG